MLSLINGIVQLAVYKKEKQNEKKLVATFRAKINFLLDYVSSG